MLHHTLHSRGWGRTRRRRSRSRRWGWGERLGACLGGCVPVTVLTNARNGSVARRATPNSCARRWRRAEPQDCAGHGNQCVIGRVLCDRRSRVVSGVLRLPRGEGQAALLDVARLGVQCVVEGHRNACLARKHPRSCVRRSHNARVFLQYNAVEHTRRIGVAPRDAEAGAPAVALAGRLGAQATVRLSGSPSKSFPHTR